VDEGQRPTDQPHDVPLPPPPGQPAQVVSQVTQPAPTNGLATAGLVCGIVGLVLFWTIWGGIILGILGIVFGAVGRGRASQGAPNRGQATAGLTLGVAAVIGSILFTILLANVISSSEDKFDQIAECVMDPDLC
jgi:hypothetical protein